MVAYLEDGRELQAEKAGSRKKEKGRHGLLQERCHFRIISRKATTPELNCFLPDMERREKAERPKRKPRRATEPG